MSIDVNVQNDLVIVTESSEDITVNVSNAAGVPGPAGVGVPVGGATGEVLKKFSNTNYDTYWAADASGLTSVGLSMPTAFTVSNTPLTSNGTIAVSGAGTAAQYIRGDGQLATFPSTSSGGSSVNYYLNGSINASVAGYKQLANTATIGGGTDFTLVGNGLIAQFLTDAGNPNRLEIPGGAWNFEMYFQVSSSGGNQKFYVELLKYNGTTFTSIASSSAVPEEITGGTAIDLYLTSLAVPTTALLVTDRLAIRVYIIDNAGGRTVTLHTEDNTLCEIITTFAGGISALNGLTANTQYLATGTSGSSFNIVSIGDTHTFNMPPSANIYTADGTLTGNRVVTMGSNTLSFEKDVYINGLTVGKGTSNLLSNTAFGINVLLNINTSFGSGNGNSAYGYESMKNMTGGSVNTAVGVFSLSAATTASFNTALGSASLTSISSGNWNSAVGRFSLASTSTGINNTAIGGAAGYGTGANANTTGENNIFIGYQSIGESATESNRTWIGNTSTVSTWVGGNLLVGTRTNGTQRLQVYGDAFIKGSGATSATSALVIQNSSGTEIFRMRNDQVIVLPNFSSIYCGSNSISFETSRILFGSNASSFAGQYKFTFDDGGGSNTLTTGDTGRFSIGSRFAPTSGNATYTTALISSTVNQTGGANGITRGLYVNPTLTAAADWRSIEWSNNSGWGLFGAGTGDNYLAGRLGIGTNILSANTKVTIVENYTAPASTGLRVKGTGSSTAVWKGRLVAGGDSVAFLMGEYNSQAWLGGHNAALNDWAPLRINPDGTTDLYLGNTSTGGSNPIITIRNSTGNVTFGSGADAGYRLDVNGTARVSGVLSVPAASGGVTITPVSSGTGIDIYTPYNTVALNINSGANANAVNITKTGYASALVLTNTTLTNTANSNISGINFTGSYQHNGSGGLGFGIISSVTNNTGSSNNLISGDFSSVANTAGATAIGLRISASSSSGTAYGLIVSGRSGFGTNTPNVSAELEVSSITRGFLPPRMTSTQKGNIASPAAGLMVFDTTLNQMSYYNGTTWINF